MWVFFMQIYKPLLSHLIPCGSFISSWVQRNVHCKMIKDDSFHSGTAVIKCPYLRATICPSAEKQIR